MFNSALHNSVLSYQLILHYHANSGQSVKLRLRPVSITAARCGALRGVAWRAIVTSAVKRVEAP